MGPPPIAAGPGVLPMNPVFHALRNLDFPVLVVDQHGAIHCVSKSVEGLIPDFHDLQMGNLPALLEIAPEEFPAWLAETRSGRNVRLRFAEGTLSPQLVIKTSPLDAGEALSGMWLVNFHFPDSPERRRSEREILIRIGSIPISELMQEAVPLTPEEPERCPITGDVIDMIVSYVGAKCALVFHDKNNPAPEVFGAAGFSPEELVPLLEYLGERETGRRLRSGVIGEASRSGLVFSDQEAAPHYPAIAELLRRLTFECHEVWIDGIGGYGAAVTFFTDAADAAMRQFSTDAFVRLGRHLETATFSRGLYSAYRELQEAQERIIQTGKMAALGEIATGVAHELRQPVTAINNFISNIFNHIEEKRFERVAERLPEYRERSNRNIDRLMGIIDHLRTFARNDAVEFVSTDLYSFFDEIHKTFFHNQLLQREIDLEWALAAELPKVEMDPRRIEQVILNLVSNAQDALEDMANPRITLGADLVEERVRLYVRDNGCGIPENIRHRILDPFFSTKPVGKGTGIGLSISHGIVQGHNGEIVVENNENGGATFSVFLPVKQNGPSGPHPERVADWDGTG